jgi:hypothetical protein
VDHDIDIINALLNVGLGRIDATAAPNDERNNSATNVNANTLARCRSDRAREAARQLARRYSTHRG